MCWATKNFRLSAVPIRPIKDPSTFDKWKLLHINCRVFVFHMIYGVIRLIDALMKYTQITSNLTAPSSQFFYAKNVLSAVNSQNLHSTNVAGCTTVCILAAKICLIYAFVMQQPFGIPSRNLGTCVFVDSAISNLNHIVVSVLVLALLPQ